MDIALGKFTVLVNDEDEVPIDGEAFDTLEEAVEIARNGAAELMVHLDHGHALPTISIYDIVEGKNVWYWCAPTLPALDN